MTNQEKQQCIRQWIDPEERITVYFLDTPDLNTQVTKCTERLVDLSIEIHVPHMTQYIAVPLSQVEASEDSAHYTQDPERPLQRHRLMLVIFPGYCSVNSRRLSADIFQKALTLTI